MSFWWYQPCTRYKSGIRLNTQKGNSDIQQKDQYQAFWPSSKPRKPCSKPSSSQYPGLQQTPAYTTPRRRLRLAFTNTIQTITLTSLFLFCSFILNTFYTFHRPNFFPFFLAFHTQSPDDLSSRISIHYFITQHNITSKIMQFSLVTLMSLAAFVAASPITPPSALCMFSHFLNYKLREIKFRIQQPGLQIFNLYAPELL